MENFNLKMLDLREMKDSELRDTNGGFKWVLVLIAGALVSELIFEGAAQCWEDFKKGFNSV